MKNFSRKLMEVSDVNFNKFIEILEDFQVVYPQHNEETFTLSKRVIVSYKIIYNEELECYCLPIQVNDEYVYVRIPVINTLSLNLKDKSYNINKKEIINKSILMLWFYRTPDEGISKYEYILKTTDEELRKLILPNTNTEIEILPVKDFMQTEGYTSVHKTVRANSQNFLYITFIKLDNSALNIYLSKKASKSFHNGQEIKKGFFSTLLVEKSSDKIRLVEKNHQSECDFPF
ncbi:MULTISPECIES: hypothetical protein [unclassified Flavobacterium]|uniref:hypothetical protein n=1 Tax=unclassified Flavobacterium TaxID=196869 RepID=UPI0013CF7E3C|nr:MULTISPECIES: hypothetical protein [unclassified Flavobacterium]MBA5793913.1 hypothetical protein [Flavobacterium sp. xlx-221]